MGLKVNPPKYQLDRKEQKALKDFLNINNQVGIRETGKRLNTNYQNVRTLTTGILRFGVTSGLIDVDALLKAYAKAAKTN